MACRRSLLVAAVTLLAYECASLRLLELRVPAAVARGARATLACRWRLDGDVLYSLKWYKDGREFFRHVPRDSQPRRSFELPGVHVERSDPSGSNVTLAPAEAATGGRYRCEVSGERPLFLTVSEHADMIVVELPTSSPILSGLRSRYRVGDRVQVTCTAGAASPPARLAWYVNGEPAPPTALAAASHRDERGLEASSLALDFRLTEHHFVDNGFKVKCVATVATLYWRSNEESAVRARTQSYDTLKLRTVTTSRDFSPRTVPNAARMKITSIVNKIMLIAEIIISIHAMY